MGQQDILQMITNNELNSLSVKFSDIGGNQKSFMLKDESINDLFNNGIWVDSSDVIGLLSICDDDLLLKPDLSSFMFNDDRAATINCKVFRINGSVHEINATEELSSLMQKASLMGIDSSFKIDDYLMSNSSGVQVISKKYNS
jgi:glutamine synthetase